MRHDYIPTTRDSNDTRVKRTKCDCSIYFPLLLFLFPSHSLPALLSGSRFLGGLGYIHIFFSYINGLIPYVLFCNLLFSLNILVNKLLGCSESHDEKIVSYCQSNSSSNTLWHLLYAGQNSKGFAHNSFSPQKHCELGAILVSFYKLGK